MTYLYVLGLQSGDAQQAGSRLFQASDGFLYGTSLAGGEDGCHGGSMSCGTVYRVSLTGEHEVVHRFSPTENDGYWPTGGVIQGKDGALYGMTSVGGKYDGGTIYRLTLSGEYKQVHSFGASATDGLAPLGALVEASDGNFYGATGNGGANHCPVVPRSGGNCGTLFRMKPSGEVSIIHSFGSAPNDGLQPNGDLIQGLDGNLYGTTVNGGANVCGSGGQKICGTIFRATLAGSVTFLHSFGSSTGDGIAPQGELVQDSDGTFYGTTSGGGDRNSGTIFRMTPSGTVSVIHRFAPSIEEGNGPAPYLTLAKDGYLYGTTISGGKNGGSRVGTIYRVSKSGSKSLLYSFGPMFDAPTAPETGIIQASDNNFYGVTRESGSLWQTGAQIGSGAVFRMEVQK